MVILKSIKWNKNICSFKYFVEGEESFFGEVTVDATNGRIMNAKYSEKDLFKKYASHAIKCVCDMFSKKDFSEENWVCWY